MEQTVTWVTTFISARSTWRFNAVINSLGKLTKMFNASRISHFNATIPVITAGFWCNKHCSYKYVHVFCNALLLHHLLLIHHQRERLFWLWCALSWHHFSGEGRDAVSNTSKNKASITAKCRATATSLAFTHPTTHPTFATPSSSGVVCHSQRSVRHISTTVRHAPLQHSPVSASPRAPTVQHATRTFVNPTNCVYFLCTVHYTHGLRCMHMCNFPLDLAGVPHPLESPLMGLLHASSAFSASPTIVYR